MPQVKSAGNVKMTPPATEPEAGPIVCDSTFNRPRFYSTSPIEQPWTHHCTTFHVREDGRVSFLSAQPLGSIILDRESGVIAHSTLWRGVGTRT